MRFVHDDHVPAGVAGLLQPPVGGRNQSDRRHDELLRQERICLRVRLVDRRATRLVEDVEPEVEAAQEFEEPLVHERIGHQYQRAADPAGQEKAMQHETGFDRLAQAHVVRQQHARGQASGDLGRHADLVR